MAEKEGNLIATGLKFALIVSRFNRFVTDNLMEGALDAFARHGGNTGDVDVIWVPGAFEMPLAAHRLAATPIPELDPPVRVTGRPSLTPSLGSRRGSYGFMP